MFIDKVDKRILILLEANARTSAAAIGRKIGLSRTAVQDRLNKLEKIDVIRGYHASIAINQVNIIRAIIYVKIAERPCKPALQWLSSLESVLDVYSLSGEVDALVICAVPTPDDLTRLNDTIGEHKFISNSNSQVILGKY